ncbi:hypothetical protein CK203_003602 [Vitis vinifera]|uniref:SHSP domain-containing protein n=1 Tax=Vitis vinifera TaxID=29760 RepID=A0A438K8W1_VITVI|nr:hypothetical protein CK203_003602 [Vitis vinifera]
MDLDSSMQAALQDMLDMYKERSRTPNQEPTGEEEGHEELVKYLKMERRIGKFLKIELCAAGQCNTEAISAVYKNGVLIVTVEKNPPPETKKAKRLKSELAEKDPTCSEHSGLTRRRCRKNPRSSDNHQEPTFATANHEQNAGGRERVPTRLRLIVDMPGLTSDQIQIGIEGEKAMVVSGEEEAGQGRQGACEGSENGEEAWEVDEEV